MINRCIYYFASDIEDNPKRTGVPWFGSIKNEATEWAPGRLHKNYQQHTALNMRENRK